MLHLLDMLYDWLYSFSGYTRGVLLASPIAIIGYLFLVWTVYVDTLTRHKKKLLLLEAHYGKGSKAQRRKLLFQEMWKQCVTLFIIIIVMLLTPGLFKL